MKKYCFIVALLLGLSYYSCQSDSSQNTTSVPTEETSEELPSDSGGQRPLSPQDPFVQKYTGTIGDKYPIEMLLTHWGDGFLTGYFFYTKTQNKIELQGEMNLDETVTLQAYLDDQTLDRFVFSFATIEKITGDWFLPKKNQQEKFTLSAVPSLAKERWSGSWYLNGIWDGGQLMIGDVKDTSFYFALSVVRNSHIGEVEGEAKIVGDSAVFERVLDFGFGEEEEPCSLTFIRNDNTINVDQRSSNLACGFGMRAFATGTYENQLKDIEPQLTFGDNAVFVSAQQHDDFMTWIGKEHYLNIAGNMQVVETRIYESEKENIQGFVSEGLVLGLYTTNEAIIMHDGNDAYWAATIDLENSGSPGQPVILYFTNQEQWKDQLPAAFERWRGSFADYPIVSK